MPKEIKEMLYDLEAYGGGGATKEKKSSGGSSNGTKTGKTTTVENQSGVGFQGGFHAGKTTTTTVKTDYTKITSEAPGIASTVNTTVTTTTTKGLGINTNDIDYTSKNSQSSSGNGVWSSSKTESLGVSPFVSGSITIEKSSTITQFPKK